MNSPSLVVGGLGGSGTRVAALVLQSAGANLGPCLNQPLDDLLFTFFFRNVRIHRASSRRFARAVRVYTRLRGGGYVSPHDAARAVGSAVVGQMVDGPEGIDEFREVFRRASWCLRRVCQRDLMSPWVVKEPNSHIFVGRLLSAWPDSRYVHIVRDGRDMAQSRNRNQLRRWGRSFGVEDDGRWRSQLDYWCRANTRVWRMASSDSRIRIWRYEDLCKAPWDFLDDTLRSVPGQTNDVSLQPFEIRAKEHPAGLMRSLSDEHRKALSRFGYE